MKDSHVNKNSAAVFVSLLQQSRPRFLLQRRLSLRVVVEMKDLSVCMSLWMKVIAQTHKLLNYLMYFLMSILRDQDQVQVIVLQNAQSV